MSTAAVAAVLMCLPAVALAQDTVAHTIVPQFPDHFVLRTTTVTDQDQVTQGVGKASHSETVVQSDTSRTPTGFHATYKLLTYDTTSKDAAGQVVPKTAIEQDMVKTMKDIGVAQVTLDNDLTPMSVDNIEDIKAAFKTMLTSSPSYAKDGMGDKLYDFMFANLTAESAADLLKQGRQAKTFFNRSMVVGQPVAMTGEPMKILGSSFNMNATLTLTSWQEGKTAHFIYVMTPTPEDLHTFIAGFMQNMMSKMMPQADASMSKLMTNMVNAMHITMTLSCDVDVNLANNLENHSVCTNKTDMSIDIKSALPPEMLKDNKAMADMPTMTMTQDSTITTDSVLVN